MPSRRTQRQERYEYVLGDSAREAQRLERQARLWDPIAGALFDRIGVMPGWKVLCRPGAHVAVVFADTGIRIAPDCLPFVFEPFRQADSRFDRAHGGLGLGLAITKQLVELHGRTIHASSGGIGHGATFTIQLPCVKSEPA